MTVFHENQTELNPEVALAFRVKGGTGVTEANPYAQKESRSFRPKEGTLLSGKYRVLRELSRGTGEADLYLCDGGGESYVAKLYRRERAVKKEVIEALASMNCPYVAKLYDTGKHNGFPYEILPYYDEGSLSGRTFSWEEIKKDILPYLNEALHALHEKGILHKDLKPSNIMVRKEGGVALIDFGISSVMGEGNTVLVTKTGMTPEYSAPETFRGVYLEESDYYSLGITLYELFTGHTPYRHMAPEVITQYMALQRIPFPEEMPEEMKNLVGALTYQDLTQRNERENPNRRWTYEEVSLFLQGEKQTYPGKGVGGILSDEIKPYLFLGKTYTTVPSLVNALGKHWNEGKKELFHGKLSDHFRAERPILARYCYEAEEESVKKVRKDDLIFWKLLYRLYPELTTVFWRGRSYSSLPTLGREILEKLWASNKKDAPYWESILKEGLLSAYLARLVRPKEGLAEAVTLLESQQILGEATEEEKEKRYYLLGYLLSGQKLLHIDGESFESPEELADYMQRQFNMGYDRLKAFVNKLVNHNLSPRAQVAAWLIAIGRESALLAHSTALE